MSDNRAFDWRPRFDERSRGYSVRALVGEPVPVPSREWPIPVWLDQGQEGACVGFGHTHRASAAGFDVDTEAARVLYWRAQELDEWDGQNYEGTSVLGGCKAAQEAGWIHEYRWAFGEPELALGIFEIGPAVIGVNWYTDMHNPDADGIIRPTGNLSGGHCVCVRGRLTDVQFSFGLATVYVIRNSWGRGWGRDGECYILDSDMAALIGQDGETCLPIPWLEGS